MSDRERLFKQRVRKCSKELRKVLRFLWTVAANAGDGVDQPPTIVGDVGIAYYAGGLRFCRFDVRFGRGPGHIFALVPSATEDDLAAVGELSKQKGWVRVKDLRAAVQLVPLILESYREATRKGRGRAKRGGQGQGR